MDQKIREHQQQQGHQVHAHQRKRHHKCAQYKRHAVEGFALGAVGHRDVALVVLLDPEPPGKLRVALHRAVAEQAAQAPAEQPAAHADADIGQRPQKALGVGRRPDQIQPGRRQQQPRGHADALHSLGFHCASSS